VRWFDLHDILFVKENSCIISVQNITICHLHTRLNIK
jgi:hypothetical protein